MLIGLGLEGNGISAKGISYVNDADVVYAEFYTSLPRLNLEEIETLVGKKIEVLTREQVEEQELPIVKAKDLKVAFLVMGDPLVATTHISLASKALELDIPLKVSHAGSIYSAIGSTGLMLYKFGKSASIVYPEDNFFPKSFYDAIIENKERGLHTLLFLDLKADKNIYMDPIDGIKLLKSVDEKGIAPSIIVASRIGWESENIVYGEIERLIEYGKEYYGPPPHCLVVPGTLHFAEEEYLSNFKV